MYDFLPGWLKHFESSKKRQTNNYRYDINRLISLDIINLTKICEI